MKVNSQYLKHSDPRNAKTFRPRFIYSVTTAVLGNVALCRLRCSDFLRNCIHRLSPSSS